MRALTPDLRASAYLAGVLHGDGWCTSESLGMRAKDEDFVRAFAHALHRTTGFQWTPNTDERGYWIVRGSNKTGRFNGLRDYEPKNDCERAAWLRGLFDSEGNAQCLRLSRGEASFQRRIAMYSTNLVTLQKASSHLFALGMDHSIAATKNSQSHKGTKTVFELRLRRRAAFQKFGDSVGSNITRKQTILDQIASTFQPPGWQARNWAKAVAARHPHLTKGMP